MNTADKMEEKSMCVALPGKVVAVEEGKAEVDFSGNRVKAYTGLVHVNPGDYVLVHAGCVIQTMKQQEAEEILELMGELDNEDNGRDSGISEEL